MTTYLDKSTWITLEKVVLLQESILSPIKCTSKLGQKNDSTMELFIMLNTSCLSFNWPTWRAQWLWKGYRLKEVQLRRTNNVLTRVKIIFCNSVLNTIHLLSQMAHEHMIRLSILLSQIKTLNELNVGPTLALHYMSSGLCLGATITSSPFGEPPMGMSSFHHEVVYITKIALYQFILLKGHVNDIVVHVESTFCPRGRWILSLEAWYPFSSRDLPPFLLEEVNLA